MEEVIACVAVRLAKNHFTLAVWQIFSMKRCGKLR